MRKGAPVAPDDRPKTKKGGPVAEPALFRLLAQELDGLLQLGIASRLPIVHREVDIEIGHFAQVFERGSIPAVGAPNGIRASVPSTSRSPLVQMT